MLTKQKVNLSVILFAALAFLFSAASAQDLEKAKHLTYSENFEEAQKSFEKLILEQPKNGDIYFYYGENYLYEYFTDTVYGSASGAAAAAEEWFKKGILADSNNPINYVGMGKVFLMNKDFAKAEAYFAKAEKKFPSKTNKTSIITPEKQALTLAKIAEAYVLINKKKDLAKAKELMERAVTLDLKNPEIYLIYGDAYIEGNDGSNAISQYKMAQELNPKSPSAKLRLGKLWIRARNYNSAIDFYKEAIEIDATFAPAYLELGKLYSKANQLDKALEYFKQYDDMTTNISAKLRYVNVLIETKKYEEALKKLDEIIKKETNRNDLNRAFAYCYFETSKFDKALESIKIFFDKAAVNDVKVTDYVYYGKILSKNTKDSLAIIQFHKALALDSTMYDVYPEIGNSYNKLKNFDSAAANYEKKIILGKASNVDYYRLGQAYYSGKKWVLADSAFAYLTKNKPEFQNGRSFYWRGLIHSNIDSTSTTWEAKPYFEKFVEMVAADSVKFAKDLVVCYDYLGSYFFLGPEKEVCKAQLYWNKILFLDPKNERALDLLDKTKGKCIPR